VEEVAEHDGGLRPLDGVGEGEIVIGVLTALGHEATQSRIADGERVQRSRELVDER
jgi:hypothetical protein